jgi:hypothetical protein
MCSKVSASLEMLCSGESVSKDLLNMIMSFRRSGHQLYDIIGLFLLFREQGKQLFRDSNEQLNLLCRTAERSVWFSLNINIIRYHPSDTSFHHIFDDQIHLPKTNTSTAMLYWGQSVPK